jgi:hypothetical protein
VSIQHFGQRSSTTLAPFGSSGSRVVCLVRPQPGHFKVIFTQQSQCPIGASHRVQRITLSIAISIGERAISTTYEASAAAIGFLRLMALRLVIILKPSSNSTQQLFMVPRAVTLQG